MNKHLLGTTALVAAGMFAMADTAAAQTKVGPVQVSIGGYYAEYVSYTSQDDVGAVANGSSGKLTQFDQFSDKEIHFNGRTNSRQRPDGRLPRRARGERRLGRPDRRIVHVHRGPLRPLRAGFDQQRPVPHGLQRARGPDAPVVERRQHHQHLRESDRHAVRRHAARHDAYAHVGQRFGEDQLLHAALRRIPARPVVHPELVAGSQRRARDHFHGVQPRLGGRRELRAHLRCVRYRGVGRLHAVGRPADGRQHQRSGSGPVEHRPAGRLRGLQDRRQLRRDERRPPGCLGHLRRPVGGRYGCQQG